MSNAMNPLDEFSDQLSAVEDLLRFAADDLPVVRSGLRSEIVTCAQKAYRELRFQQYLWGAATTLLLLLAGLVWWPASTHSDLAATEEPHSQPAKASLLPASDSVDWALVEAKTQLRRRNLEILRNAF